MKYWQDIASQIIRQARALNAVITILRPSKLDGSISPVYVKPQTAVVQIAWALKSSHRVILITERPKTHKTGDNLFRAWEISLKPELVAVMRKNVQKTMVQ